MAGDFWELGICVKDETSTFWDCFRNRVDLTSSEDCELVDGIVADADRDLDMSVAFEFDADGDENSSLADGWVAVDNAETSKCVAVTKNDNQEVDFSFDFTRDFETSETNVDIAFVSNGEEFTVFGWAQ